MASDSRSNCSMATVGPTKLLEFLPNSRLVELAPPLSLEGHPLFQHQFQSFAETVKGHSINVSSTHGFQDENHMIETLIRLDFRINPLSPPSPWETLWVKIHAGIEMANQHLGRSLEAVSPDRRPEKERRLVAKIVPWAIRGMDSLFLHVDSHYRNGHYRREDCDYDYYGEAEDAWDYGKTSSIHLDDDDDDDDDYETSDDDDNAEDGVYPKSLWEDEIPFYLRPFLSLLVQLYVNPDHFSTRKIVRNARAAIPKLINIRDQASDAYLTARTAERALRRSKVKTSREYNREMYWVRIRFWLVSAIHSAVVVWLSQEDLLIQVVWYYPVQRCWFSHGVYETYNIDNPKQPYPEELKQQRIMTWIQGIKAGRKSARRRPDPSESGAEFALVSSDESSWSDSPY